MSDLTPYTSTLQTNLGCVAGDRIAIITDDGPFAKPDADIPDRRTLARLLQDAATSLDMHCEIVDYANLGGSGIEPPAEVYDQVYPNGFCDFARQKGLLMPLLDKTITTEGLQILENYLKAGDPRFEAILVLSRYSISHTRFRKLLTENTITKGATMPGVEPYMFKGVMTADWQQVEARSLAIAKLLSAAEKAVILSAGGRTLELSLAGRAGLADTGLITKPGDFGNLPGGEAFIAPLEGSANGELSVGLREQPDQWAFRFKNGKMVEILGDPPFRKRLETAIEKHELVRNVAELGVGTNEKASAPDNTLEAEKILGTVHLALGDNASFGGTVSVPFHQDYVVYRPSLEFVDPDGTVHKVLDEGKFLL